MIIYELDVPNPEYIKNCLQISTLSKTKHYKLENNFEIQCGGSTDK